METQLDVKTFRRTVVIGTSGSGKSTVSARLAKSLGSDHVELDSIFWGPGWRPSLEDLELDAGTVKWNFEQFVRLRMKYGV